MTTYVNAAPGDALKAGERYRATWGATRVGAELPVIFGGADVAGDLGFLFDSAIGGSGLVIVVSHPAVPPGSNAGTLDLQVIAGAQAKGATVADLARALQNAVPPVKVPVVVAGADLELVRLERYAAGGGSAAATAARDAATAAVSDSAEHAGLRGAADAVTSGVRGVLIIAAIAAAGWVILALHPVQGPKDWL